MAIPAWLLALLMERIGPNATRKRLRETARELRQAAGELERRADAVLTQERRRTWQPGQAGREPGTYVVVDYRYGHLEIRIGKALYRQIGTLPRLDVQRHAGRAALVAVWNTDDGYKVNGGVKLAPRIKCLTAADVLGLDDGRYAAEVHGDRIVIGEEL